MATVGNTIRLRAEFRTFDGTLTSPNNVELTIYDYRRDVLIGPIPISIDNAVSEGIFEYDYTIISGTSMVIYYQFSAILEGTPIVARGKIPVSWV